ncbi:MAG: hypothetical protein ACI8SN_001789, partial [Algoriphagus sp.]
GDYRPTDQSIEVKTELVTKIDAELTRFRKLEREQISKILNIEDMKTKLDKKK